MIDLILPVLCSIVVLALLIRFLISPTRILGLNLLSSAIAVVSFSLLPSRFSLAFDHAIGHVGVGYLLARLGFTTAVSFHGMAVRLGVGDWKRVTKMRVFPVLLLLTAVFVLCWILTQRLPASDPTALYYQGYRGRPDTVFWMSVSRGLTIIWYSAFAAHAYILAARQNPAATLWRAVVQAPVLVCVGFVANGALGVIALIEALSDYVGHPILLPEVYFSALILAIGSIMVVYVLYMTIEPVRTWYHDMRAAPALLAAAKQTRSEAQYYFSETVDTEILLRDYADPDILRIAKEVCATAGLDREDRETVLAAAREMTLRPDHIDKLRHVGEVSLDVDGMAAPVPAAEVARYYATQSQRSDFDFLADRAIIAALACGAEHLGTPFSRPITERHRRLGRLLFEVFLRYDQPERYLQAFQKELAARERERQDALSEIERYDDEPRRERGS